MSYDLYWYGDPSIATDYYEAYTIKRELENERLWLEGLYTYKAVDIAIFNNISRGKQKPQKYPSKPFDLTPKEEVNEDKLREESIRELNAWKLAWSKQHGTDHIKT